MRQMRVRARAGIQVRLGDSQGEGPFIREAAEADAGEGQDQTVGAPKLLPETPTGLPEPGQHQRGGWRAREGGLQGDAKGEYGTLRIRVLVREVGHVSVFYKDRKKMPKGQRM